MKNIIIFLLLFVEIINAQSLRNQHEIPIIPQGFNFTLLSGYGNSGLLSDAANIGAINPAALEIFSKISFGVSYQLETKLKESWIADIGSERINKSIPQSFGLILPFKNIKLGFAVNQIYNRALLFGLIPVTTIENPDGTGEFMEVENKNIIHNYSIIASYTSTELLPSSILSLGIRISLNNLNNYERIWHSEHDASIYSNSFSIGGSYTLNTSNNGFIKLGLMFESGYTFSEFYDYKNDYLVIHDTIAAPNSLPAILPTGSQLVLKMPPTLRFDYDINAFNRIRLLGSISNIFWGSISNNNLNEIELSGNIIFDYNMFIVPSIGFVFKDRNYAEDFFGLNENLNAFFLTVSWIMKISKIKIHLALADAHLLSGEWRKQTIFKGSINYSF